MQQIKEQITRPNDQIRLPLGRLVGTPSALDLLNSAGVNPITLLERHHTGDWGDLDAEDWETNQYSLIHGLRILSSYRLDQNEKVWIITEADRSVTTILLPSDY